MFESALPITHASGQAAAGWPGWFPSLPTRVNRPTRCSAHAAAMPVAQLPSYETPGSCRIPHSSDVERGDLKDDTVGRPAVGASRRGVASSMRKNYATSEPANLALLTPLPAHYHEYAVKSPGALTATNALLLLGASKTARRAIALAVPSELLHRVRSFAASSAAKMAAAPAPVRSSAALLNSQAGLGGLPIDAGRQF